MTDDDLFELSRRKALAGLGSIGVASAGAGLGTSAFFSDEENFQNNQLTAGELDMKVAWQEHYADWIGAEADDAHMPSSGETPTFRLPAPPESPDAQDIEPDAQDIELVVDDGQGFLSGSLDDSANGGIYGSPDDLCGTDADVGDGPLIDLGDVKPGDFGFGLFKFQLCTNPGKLWLTGGLVSADENGQSEPEAEDEDEYGDAGATNPALIELLDAIQVAIGVGTTSDLSASNPEDNLFPEPDPDSTVPQPRIQFSLREFLQLVAKGDGLPLAGDIDAERGGGTGRPCFSGGQVSTDGAHFASIVWWLPVDHANQVQTDKAVFDVGFYTEQCRHNGTADAFVGKGGDLQAAVDAASTGDTIEVAAETFAGPLDIGTAGLTLRSVGPRATIEGGGANAAVNINADDVTFEGFEVTNSGGLLGVSIAKDIDGATVRCNRIRDIGPTGNVGVTGIIIQPGDSGGHTIANNYISDLVQNAPSGYGPTVNGILLEEGSLTDTTVADNTISYLRSDLAPLGIVVQPDVDGLSIEGNLIADLLAANSLGDYTGTTFAQGLSINAISVSGSGFDVTGNTVAQVVSEDGYFGEDIKLEDGFPVADITISGNNLLSAIGLNNANGANSTVTAENNYWGSSGGPFEILNNEADGDVPTGSGQVDLDTVAASAVTQNVDYDPFASSSQ